MKRTQFQNITCYPPSSGTIFLRGLKTKCIIGIFDWERKKKQTIIADFKFPSDIAKAAKSDNIRDTEDYKTVAKTVLNLISKSSYFLIETLAEDIASAILQRVSAQWVHVTVSKPGAVRFSENVGIEITRHRNEMRKISEKASTVYLSVGSNINRQQSIKRALSLLKETFEYVRHSSIYESAAVGREKSPDFWNLVVEIRTELPPDKLKKKLVQIEKQAGRIKNSDKFAPRIIDIDIVFYGSKILKDSSCRIPHADADRAHYIIIPMIELNPQFKHPTA
ncbi:MAG: 2-amino-4-hydroxy-6-hydroxymethyldihydropteridine diphosphokinase, partial [Leptospiraceae bacterium]|nr:2-amino-4-hydroxy-6-hydroxymethyldihydropteridine diphosphokinase [Leptospiraceae bacterium]